MSLAELLYKITTTPEAFTPPLSNREIIDIIMSYSLDPEVEEETWGQKAMRIMKEREEEFTVPYDANKKTIREIKKKLNERINETMDRKRNATFDTIFIDLYLKELSEKKLKLDKMLTYKKGEFNIQLAKQYPIDQLLEFKGGFTKCIWHNEDSPSMKYYKKSNTTHCFGCQRNGDAIDVLMEMRKIPFTEAVRYLTE